MNRLVVFFTHRDTEGTQERGNVHTGTATVRELA